MNKECIIVLKLADNVPLQSEYDYYGVDAGALYLAKKGQHMLEAIGDFDSVHIEDLKKIEQYANQIEKLNPIKDDSDSEHAINKIAKKGYEKIYVYGGIGGRLDHEIVNIRLCEKYPNKVVFLNEYNSICCYLKGKYFFQKKYDFISVFATEKSIVSWENTKYLLDKKEMDEKDLFGLSNEIIEEPAILEVHEGKVLIVQTKDKKRFLD